MKREGKQLNNMQRLKSKFTIGASVILALSGLLAAIRGLLKESLLSDFLATFKYHNFWLWVNLAIIFLFLASDILVFIWIWKINLSEPFRSAFTGGKPSFFLKILITLVIQTAFIFLVVYFAPSPDYFYHDTNKVFSQTDMIGSVGISSYASNGEARYEIIEGQNAFGPDAYVSVVLKTYNTSHLDNCGLIFSFIKGTDLGPYKYIRFQIQSARGNETLGIKAKDARGVEVSLPRLGGYVHGGKITDSWEDVSVPFSDFGNVDWGLMDNFSVYLTGDVAETRPHTFNIGNIRFIK